MRRGHIVELKHHAAVTGWTTVLTRMGVSEELLSGKAQPCPRCGGDDRFQVWRNKKTNEYHFQCRGCAESRVGKSTGDSIDLVRLLFGWTYREALNEMRKAIGVVTPLEPWEVEEKRKAQQREYAVRRNNNLQRIKEVWASSTDFIASPAQTYLQSRGLHAIPIDVRFGVVSGKGTGGAHPAMLAAVRNAEGHIVTIHRTFITRSGEKAGINGGKGDKQIMPVVGTKNGGAVRLSKVTNGVLGVAEGIETAMAASVLHNVPVWSTLDASGLETFEIPSDLQLHTLMIFGDRDANGHGQSSVAKLMLRYPELSMPVIPPSVGVDWNDELQEVLF